MSLFWAFLRKPFVFPLLDQKFDFEVNHVRDGSISLFNL